MDGIRIPKDLAAAEGVPEDLDSGIPGPYRFPSPDRRRSAAFIYVMGAVIAALGALAGLASGLWVASVGFLGLAYLHDRAAWPLVVDQEQALGSAATRIPFPVGHASAALGFRGLRSRPVWNVILYSSSDPPDRRALVRLDAVTGEQIDSTYIQDLEGITVPEGL